MFEKIIEMINKSSKIGIFTHSNPDGDALGSSYSLKLVLESMEKQAEVFTSGKTERKLDALLKKGECGNLKPEECDLLAALDSADIDRLGEWKEVFEVHPATFSIDHHITHIPFAKETVMSDVSSTCEVVWQLYKEMDIPLSLDVASNLYIGILTDTGNFKYSCVSGETHRIVADLIDGGVDFATISKKLFGTLSREYLRLKARAIGKTEYLLDGRAAMLCLTPEDFDACEINEADASPIVTLPCSAEGVEVGIYVRKRESNEYKVSLRSVNYVDVAEIASSFGGGGHIRAAGYSVDECDYADNIECLLREIEKRLNR